MTYPLKRSTLTLTACLLLFSAVLYAAPGTWEQSVTYNGETITMRLTKQTLRGPNFELWAQNASGDYVPVTPVEERSYIGTVDEYPNAISSGILQDGGQFQGAVYFDRGGTWFTLGSSVTSTKGLDQPTIYNFPSYTVSAGHAGTTMYRFDVGIDADYDYYSSRAGGDVAKAFEMIEYSVTTTRALYMQNVLLRPYLGRVIIRTDQAQDPADGLTGNDYFNAVKNEWNNNQTDADRDVVAGVTKSDVGGGLAAVGVIHETSGYSVSDSWANGDFGNIWRHELGHNWGMNHFDGGTGYFKPEGVTINSGNQYARMSGPEVERALVERDEKLTYLDDESTYTGANIPPYASLDAVTFTQVVDTQIDIDVMANDYDANGDALSILSFDAVSAQGGSITLSGSGSSATLVYTPPSDDYAGSDWFYYEIQDASGQTATGVVTINVDVNSTLRGYWPMDESSGTVLEDASVFDHIGTPWNGPVVGVAGQFGNAVTLDGSDDWIEVDNLTLNTNTVTMTAWIKRNGTQSDNSAIVINKAFKRAEGLNFGPGNQLGYHWNGTEWVSGLVPTDGQWVFAALVVEPTKATIYMYDGSLQSAVHSTAHTALSFAAATYIGLNYKGSIDDVRVYSRALTQAEILDLVDGGGAECLHPFDGQEGVPTDTDLQWSPGAAAVDYDVYLGTDYDAVLNATTGSPEHQDTVSGTTYTPTLEPAKFYYWRIDTNTSGGTIPGKVCSFLTGNLIVLVNACDFESGFGNWVNISDDPNWLKLHSGSTPTALTGPSGGADGSTWYAYMETTPGEGASNAGDTVILESPDLDADAYSMRLDFHYHMYGEDIGTLNVDVYDGTWHEGVWSITGQQQGSSEAAYEIAQLDLSSYSGTIKVRFRAVAAGDWRGDIAIDNITITGMLIPQVISECDFESGFGDWVNVGYDDYDWTRHTEGTQTPNTGPSGGADGSTWYAYMETSSGGASEAGDTVILESPDLDADAYSMRLDFDYHMYGVGIGTLNVDVYDGTWHEAVWSISGQQQGSSEAAYEIAQLDLSSYSGTIKVRFRAVATGDWRGDIAIDNITITGTAPPPSLEFVSDPILLSDGLEGRLYDDTLAGSATDPIGGTVTYSITSDPSWLITDPNGALSGIPHDPDVGLNEFTVRATGINENYAEATLQINVVNRFMGENGLADFAGFAANWLDSNCGICNGADLDDDNDVGPADLNILAQNWLAD